MTSKQYYILRQGTNERIINRGTQDALIVTEEYIEDEIRLLEKRIPGIGYLEAVSIDDFFTEYHLPSVQAKRRAMKELDNEGDS